MAQKVDRIQANIQWLIQFANARYLQGVNIPFPGKGASAAEAMIPEDEKKEVDMDLDEPEDVLMESFKKAFPTYELIRNYREAHAVALNHLGLATLQEISSDPELLNMMVSPFLSS